MRMQRERLEPLLIADWDRVLMIHGAVEPAAFQADAPFRLDLHEGRAYVTLVAFTMRGMRPHWGGRLTARLFGPLATHEFLNVRTYVRVGGDVGIHFLAEWVSNRFAATLGPWTFALPYRHGRIRYDHNPERGHSYGRVQDSRTGRTFSYRAEWDAGTPPAACEPGTRDSWLMERYAAFNAARGRSRYFRVWHEPWRQCRATVIEMNVELLLAHWPWFRDVEWIGAHYSPGARNVWLGRPRRVGFR